jgi:hypothetical protein
VSYYKYMQRHYADAMLTEGKIRLGSFDGYAGTEAADLARSDRDEGRPGTTVLDYQQAPGAALHPKIAAFLGSPHNREVTFRRNLIVSRSPAAQLFCVANVPRYRIMKGFDCDACVEIHQPPPASE